MINTPRSATLTPFTALYLATNARKLWLMCSCNARQPIRRAWRRLGQQIAIAMQALDASGAFDRPFDSISDLKLGGGKGVNAPGFA